jgi:hypothetical protein
VEPAELTGVALVGGLDPQLDLAMELREKGVRVLALADDCPEEEALKLAAEAGIPYVLLPEEERFRLMDVKNGDSVTLVRDELPARLGV